MLINNNSDTVSKGASSLDSASVEAFNSKFLCYVDDSAPGTTAKALEQTVIQNNSAIKEGKFDPTRHEVYLNYYKYGQSDNRWT